MLTLNGNKLVATIVALILFSATFAQSRTHYVDPNFSNDLVSNGSVEAPWKNLQRLFDRNSIEAGDKIILLSGYYGRLFVQNKRYKKTVHIIVGDKHTAKFGKVRIWGSQNLKLEGLTVSPSFLPKYDKGTIVEISRESKAIRIEKFDIFSVPDISGWNKEKWNEKSANGFFANGSRNELIDSKIRNVNYAISIVSGHSKIVGNVVKNFSGDGIRVLGDYTLIEKNVVTNCFQVNDNHPDGVQSWSIGSDGKVGTGTVRGVVLRRNLIVNFEDLNQPFRCKMQGIGLFDGMFADWVIENNIIVADHWHGITVLGAENVRIVNNTVFDPVYGRPGPPWIKVGAHKNGIISKGNLIANNLAGSYDNRKIGVLHLKNLTIRDEDALFENSQEHDFRLKEGSRAIDEGMLGLHISDDFYGNNRPMRQGIDVGAVEKQ